MERSRSRTLVRLLSRDDERTESAVYAVIRTGGKQYRVQVGDLVDVELLPNEEGDEIRFEPLLVVGDDGDVRTAGDVAGAAVTATVVEQRRGPKLRVATYKNKSRQKRTLGHRQRLTRLRVAGIETAAEAAKQG